jgi:hypothetical protein
MLAQVDPLPSSEGQTTVRDRNGYAASQK